MRAQHRPDMTENPTPASTRTQAAAAAVAILIAVFRAATLPPAQWWRDWVLLLTLYGLYSLFRRRSESWPIVTATLMAFLLGLYVQGQAPHVLAVLGSGR